MADQLVLFAIETSDHDGGHRSPCGATEETSSPRRPPVRGRGRRRRRTCESLPLALYLPELRVRQLASEPSPPEELPPLRGPRSLNPRRHLSMLQRDAYPEHPAAGHGRPRTRGECVEGPRPCPWVSCRHHLALDIRNNGTITLNHPGVELGDLEETCALDVADRGSQERAHIGRLLGVSDERVRQIEADGTEAIRWAVGGYEEES